MRCLLECIATEPRTFVYIRKHGQWIAANDYRSATGGGFDDTHRALRALTDSDRRISWRYHIASEFMRRGSDSEDLPLAEYIASRHFVFAARCPSDGDLDRWRRRVRLDCALFRASAGRRVPGAARPVRPTAPVTHSMASRSLASTDARLSLNHFALDCIGLTGRGRPLAARAGG